MRPERQRAQSRHLPQQRAYVRRVCVAILNRFQIVRRERVLEPRGWNTVHPYSIAAVTCSLPNFASHQAPAASPAIIGHGETNRSPHRDLCRSGGKCCGGVRSRCWLARSPAGDAFARGAARSK